MNQKENCRKNKKSVVSVRYQPGDFSHLQEGTGMSADLLGLLKCSQNIYKLFTEVAENAVGLSA
jgi:hypothetical protein